MKYIVTDLVHMYDPRSNIGHVDLGVITIQLIDQCIAYIEQGGIFELTTSGCSETDEVVLVKKKRMLYYLVTGDNATG